MGARAVLAKSNGRFVTKITAINSTCPFKLNANASDNEVTANTSTITMAMINKIPNTFGNPAPKIAIVPTMTRV